MDKPFFFQLSIPFTIKQIVQQNDSVTKFSSIVTDCSFRLSLYSSVE